MTKLVNITNYGDLHRGNILRDQQHEIVIVDTENRSFCLKNKTFSMIILRNLTKSYGSDEAFQYVDSAIDLEKSILSIIWSLVFESPSLQKSTQYDDADIDFEKVKEEFAQLQNENRKKQNE